MFIAYLLLCHKNTGQIVDFIEKLSSPEALFYLHVDRKSNIYADLNSRLNNRADVLLLKERYKINWGGYGIITASLRLIQEALKSNADYVSLHSCQDFPIKNNQEILQYIDERKGYEFMTYFQLPSPVWENQGMERIDYYWLIDSLKEEEVSIFVEAQKRLKAKRKYLEDLQPYGGSNWWTITRECAGYILEFLKKHPCFCDYYKYTLIPGEMFFQSIVLNSPFKGRIKNDNLLYVDWTNRGAHPKVLTASEDYQKIISSGKLFARKFDVNIDREIIELLKNNC